MKVWGVSEADIRAAVSEARLAVWDDYQGRGIVPEGRGLLVRLVVDPTQPRDEEGLLPFQKRGQPYRGYQGRRTPYVTWEGHREFMRILFRDHPEAKLKSALATYNGRKDFWAKHPATRGGWPSVNPGFGIRR